MADTVVCTRARAVRGSMFEGLRAPVFAGTACNIERGNPTSIAFILVEFLCIFSLVGMSQGSDQPILSTVRGPPVWGFEPRHQSARSGHSARAASSHDFYMRMRVNHN